MLPSSFVFIVSAGVAFQASALVLVNPPERTHDRIRMVDKEHLDSFTRYLTKHGKSYEQDSQEFDMRLELFMRRAAEVKRQNDKKDRLWTAALNKFSDRTEQELEDFRGYRPVAQAAKKKRQYHIGNTEDVNLDVIFPQSVDWTNWSSLSWIRDQGPCGSCWAVTATTVLNAQSEIHGTNRTFSTQQVIDCVPNPHSCGGSGGCDGATAELAFQYTMLAGMQQPEQYGQYKAQTSSCSFVPKSSPSMSELTEFGTDAKTYEASSGAPGHAFGMYAWQKLASNKERPLIEALVTVGPVAIAVVADSIFAYSSGILDTCAGWVVNHAVTLVGYGVDNGNKYWHIQNSWGESWGEGGRIRIARSDDEEGKCGMDNQPQVGIACEGETDPVRVCGTCGVLFDSVLPLFRSP